MFRCTFLNSRLALWIVAVTMLSSCSSTNLKSSEDPQVLYNEAVRLSGKDRYLEAGEYLAELKRRFPQSRFVALADLKTADMEFEQDNFAEAAAAYGVFVELFPNHSEAAYALHRKIIAHFKDAPDNPARDQGPAEDAVKSADLFLKRYASSPLKPEVEKLRIGSRLKLAQKEAYVARFYERRKATVAALGRWKNIQNRFGDIEAVDEGKKLLDETARAIQKLGSPSNNNSEGAS